MREKLQIVNKSTALNVVESKINSIRKKEILHTGCRVYDGIHMGVSGTLGEATEDTWREAENNLRLEIDYPFEPTKNVKKSVDLREDQTTDEELLEIADEVLLYLREKHPEFSYQGKISTYESGYTLTNEEGLDLDFKDRTVSVSLDVKELSSVNILDSNVGYSHRRFDKAKFFELADHQLTAYLNKVDMPKDELYVIMDPTPMLRKIDKELNGESIGRGTSLLTNKMKTQVFSKLLTIYKDSTAEDYHHCQFFDMEGTINEGNRLTLIDHGIPLKPYTDKRTAEKYSMELTGNASGGYDDVPMLGGCLLNIERSDKTLKELLSGRLGLVVHISSGGDFTAAGDYAAPVQLAYLTDGDKLIGRLPECNISGNIFEILGKDYVGFSKDKELMDRSMLVTKLKIS